MQCLLSVVLVVLVHDALASRPGYEEEGYEKRSYHQTEYYKPKTKSCYQCAYSPPKTYYDKKVHVESVQYGKHYGQEQKSYGQDQAGYGQQEEGYGKQDGSYGSKHGGYTKKTYVPVPYTINGGWDKCLGPFDHYQAQRFGIDVWDCHSNCYVRKDPNGNIFRGCYKGEFGVDPYKTGCHYQAGAVYCFCEGDKCNNGPAPH